MGLGPGGGAGRRRCRQCCLPALRQRHAGGRVGVAGPGPCPGCLDRPQGAPGAAPLVALSGGLPDPGAGGPRSAGWWLREGQRGPRRLGHDGPAHRRGRPHDGISCTGSGGPTGHPRARFGRGWRDDGRLDPARGRGVDAGVRLRPPRRGWSEAPPHAKHAIANAADLHTLLARAMSTAPTSWWGTPPAAPTSRSTPRSIPTRSPAWRCWTPSRAKPWRGCPLTPGCTPGMRKGMALAPSLARTGAMRLFYKTRDGRSPAISSR